jgi:uncharacterized phage-associated protein
MATATDVAKYLAQLAESAPEPDELSHLRIQKLLYYVQGWSLALRGRPMFEEPIEAWPHGPVVPQVYHRLKEFGYRSIPASEIPGAALSKADAAFVGRVWSAYSEFSATKLRDMTHAEAPWQAARNGRNPDAPGRRITHDSMRRYFKAASNSQST